MDSEAQMKKDQCEVVALPPNPRVRKFKLLQIFIFDIAVRLKKAREAVNHFCQLLIDRFDGLYCLFKGSRA